MNEIRSTKLAAILGLTLWISSCATINQTMERQRYLELDSVPLGAHVYLIGRNGADISLGETPLSLDKSKIQSFQTDFIGFRFEKEGYEVERVYLTLPSKNIEGSLKITLKSSTDWSQAFVDKKASKYLDEVAGMTAEVQGALASNDLNAAESKGRALVTRYPNLSVGWNLLGNVFFLQGRKAEALEAYNKAIGIDPTNQVTQNLIEKMKGL